MRKLLRMALGRTLPSVALRGAFGFAALAMVAGHGVAQPPASGIWLDQGWSAAERDQYHHQSQGTLTLPIPTSWFLALQQPGLSPSNGLFSDPAYLDRFGFIPSPQGAANPLGLPVGFARTQGTDPRNGQPIDRLGLTCAACHTGRIDTPTASLYIDGGPALIDLGTFGTRLALALGETYVVRRRFNRFADRVLGPNSSPQAREQLRAQLKAIVDLGLGQLLQTYGQHNTAEGFGRLDALNRIGNTVFADGLGIRQNNAAITAPVAFPHIWSTSWFTWVQYNGSIEQPMVRNAGEAMGVSAAVNYNGDSPTPRFTSTIPVGDLHDRIEALLAGDQPTQATGFTGLRAPAWPVAQLGEIVPRLAQQGAILYRERCQGCHLPAPNTPEFWQSTRWTAPNAAGQRYLDLPMIPISTVGTDPEQAAGMANRTVLAPASLGLTGSTGTSGNLNRYSYGPALGQLVELVVNRWYDSQTPPTSPAERDRLNGYRPNGIRAPLAYKARPLNGIWATAPFLHNGSVPTLWALLSPMSERPRVFNLGNRRFNARWVGYENGGGTEIDTRRRGNSNAGHLFDNPPAGRPSPPGRIGPLLTPDQRMALIEYLKTL